MDRLLTKLNGLGQIGGFPPHKGHWDWLAVKEKEGTSVRVRREAKRQLCYGGAVMYGMEFGTKCE